MGVTWSPNVAGPCQLCAGAAPKHVLSGAGTTPVTLNVLQGGPNTQVRGSSGVWRSGVPQLCSLMHVIHIFSATIPIFKYGNEYWEPNQIPDQGRKTYQYTDSNGKIKTKILHCRVYVLIVFCLEWQMSKFKFCQHFEKLILKIFETWILYFEWRCLVIATYLNSV
jgi:hypothetical protein